MAAPAAWGPDSSGPGRGLSNPRPGRRRELRCGCSAEDRTDLAERAAHPERRAEQALEVQEELTADGDRSRLADRGRTREIAPRVEGAIARRRDAGHGADRGRERADARGRET